MPIDKVVLFQKTVLDFYDQNQRILPWRDVATITPYNVLVSELMLQQTQVARVIDKYTQFVEAFPDVEKLAHSDLASILRLWQGLGYNRRAKYLHDSAKMVMEKYNGVFPDSINELVKLPGVGVNTGSAILAYAYDQPCVYIETNIRTVFLHHFFDGREGVTDKEIMPYIEKALLYESPRIWYWALMDYGTYLKKTVGNQNIRSKHYTKQSKFEGSDRQLRGRILRLLSLSPLPITDIYDRLLDDRTDRIVAGLKHDGLVVEKGGQLELAR